MPDSPLKITPRLKELCKKRGVSLYRLAKDIKRAPNTISRIAKGERGASRKLQAEICSYLDCQPGDLFVLEKSA